MFTELLDARALGVIYNFLATLLLSDFKTDKAFRRYNSSIIKVLSVDLSNKYKFTIFISAESIKDNKNAAIQDLANRGLITQLGIYRKSDNKDCAFMKLLNKNLKVLFYSDEEEIMQIISRLDNYFSAD